MGELVAVPMDQMSAMARAMASSGLFGVKTPDQALALMLVAQAQGISPATACVDFDIIQGKPAMTARAMLARFQQAGGIIKWLQYTDTVCEAAFSHPQCPEPINIKWTMQDATRAGLTGKDNWRKYPRQMLSSRVMSEGVDRCYPAASGGFYPPEVVQDFAKEKTITPTTGAGEELTEERKAEIAALVDKVKDWMTQGSLTDAFMEIDNAALDTEEKVYLWTFFDSGMRRQLKEEAARQQVRVKAIESKVITEPQRKRLEALIGEHGLDRDAVKAECEARFSKNHFAELSMAEYESLCTDIDQRARQPEAATSSVPPDATVAQAGESTYISADQCIELETLCNDGGIEIDRLKKKVKVERLALIPAEAFERSVAWVKAAIEAKREAS